jgi:hypothetical protein
MRHIYIADAVIHRGDILVATELVGEEADAEVLTFRWKARPIMMHQVMSPELSPRPIGMARDPAAPGQVVQVVEATDRTASPSRR